MASNFTTYLKRYSYEQKCDVMINQCIHCVYECNANSLPLEYQLMNCCNHCLNVINISLL